MTKNVAAGSESEAEIEGLLARIAQLRPLLRENGAQGEQDRRVPEESIDALRRVGALRVSVAKRYGGYDMGHGDAMRVGREVGRADGGTAWVVSLLNSGAWYTRQFSEQAQDDIFAENPDTLVSAVVAPTGTARKVPGGYEVTGKWSYNSGSWHADWALVAVRLLNAEGEPAGEGQVLIPASDYVIEDVWRVAGMRSSGSNLLVADGAFVPEHRALVTVPADAAGGADGAAGDGADGAEPQYRAASVPLALLGPQLGLGRAILDAVLLESGGRGVAYTSIERRASWVPFQLDVARAAQMLDTADLFAESAAAYLDSLDLGAPVEYLERARVRGDVGWAVENVTGAIELLLSASGSGAFADSNAVQRLWRDQAVVARHGYVSPPLALEIYGKALLGEPNPMTVLI
ncbi:MAG: acyl-CoA dehydrogenase family protein [Leucobacter sp.]|nr:acyl-CoA dehydrogenase family protein [Leucobacter sp.]